MKKVIKKVLGDDISDLLIHALYASKLSEKFLFYLGFKQYNVNRVNW